MDVYEKPTGGRSQASKYVGVIAVMCLFAALFAIWALMTN
jgi:hypothetical protein